MRKLLLQLKSDLGFGLLGQWRRYLAAVIAVAIVCGISIARISSGLKSHRAFAANKEQLVMGNVSFGDIFCGLFGGCEAHDPDEMVKWALPVVLLFVCALVFYITLDYPYRDLAGMGKQLIVAAGSRWGWWISKCVWVFAAASVFYALVLGVVAASTAAIGGVWNAELWYMPAISLELRTSSLIKPEVESPANMTFMGPDGTVIDMDDSEAEEVFNPLADAVSTEDMEAMRWSIAPCLAGVFLMLVALCMVQLVLSLLVGPLVAFGASISTILVSAWAVHPALLGNYLMVTRTTEVSSVGVDVGVGVVVSVALIVASVIVGGFAFSRMDILGGERWAS